MKFKLGQVVGTPPALEALEQSGQTPIPFLARHVNGDWGDVCKEDQKANDHALEHGHRLLSAYKTSQGATIWIITEWDRSVTTILLPDDY